MSAPRTGQARRRARIDASFAGTTMRSRLSRSTTVTCSPSCSGVAGSSARSRHHVWPTFARGFAPRVLDGHLRPMMSSEPAVERRPTQAGDQHAGEAVSRRPAARWAARTHQSTPTPVSPGRGTAPRAPARRSRRRRPTPMPGMNSSAMNIAMRHDQQGGTGVVHGQHRQREQRQDQEGHPDDPAETEPRVRDLVEDRQRAQREQDEREVGVRQQLQDAGAAGSSRSRPSRAGGREGDGVAPHLDLTAVDARRAARRGRWRSGRSPDPRGRSSP
jgi:hypothetical protein